MQTVYAMKAAAKVSTTQLAEQPGDFIMVARSGFGVTKVFDKVGAERVELVWSQWSGYWNRERCAMREWAEREGVTAHFVHSVGPCLSLYAGLGLRPSTITILLMNR